MDNLCIDFDSNMSNMAIPAIIMLTQATILLIREFRPNIKKIYLLGIVWSTSVFVYMAISRIDGVPLFVAFLKGNVIAYTQVFGHRIVKAVKG